MLFNSLTFLIFFAAVTALFWLIPTWNFRRLLLLAASYVFYAAWNPPFSALLLFSTSMDWWLARQIGRSTAPARRHALLLCSLTANLALLGFFKYGNFLTGNFESAALALGVPIVVHQLDLVLPIGISFYTFASLSYTIDVYRREIDADWSFRDYALFVSFFPHLVAGPIVRANRLLPQIRAPRSPSYDQIGWGLSLFVFGLFDKVVLADFVFAPLVDAVYSAPDRYGAMDLWAAVLCFSGQIYYDFAGYSLCAIGLALTFGFSFPDNFRYPYAALGFRDFWRRWHISLSTWLRDYLYLSLGGSHGGKLATYRNLMLTMTIGGLWHGASWMFVLWGSMHGIYLVVERWLSAGLGRSKLFQAPPTVIYAALTFILISLTWIPFRAKDLHTLGLVATGLLGNHHSNVMYSDELGLPLLAMVATFYWHWKMRASSLEAIFGRMDFRVHAGLIASCLIVMFLCSGGEDRAFIYFQF